MKIRKASWVYGSLLMGWGCLAFLSVRTFGEMYDGIGHLGTLAQPHILQAIPWVRIPIVLFKGGPICWLAVGVLLAMAWVLKDLHPRTRRIRNWLALIVLALLFTFLGFGLFSPIGVSGGEIM